MINKKNIKKVVVPQLSPNDTEATLVEWSIKDGDRVQEGEVIFSLETAKAIAEIESEYSGTIFTLINEGEVVKIGDTIALIGDDLEQLNQAKKDFFDSITVDKYENINATQKAIRRANDLNIDISKIQQDGIIKEKDVELYFESIQEKSDVDQNEELIDLNDYQKEVINTISWQKENAITGYVEKIIDIESAKKYSISKQKSNGWLFDPFFAIIAFNFVKCIKSNNHLNVTILNDKILRYKGINLGLTIDIEDKLMIVVLPKADKYNEEDFINNLFSLQKRAATKRLKFNETQKPTVGITSLAAHGVSRHIPILIPNTSIMLALSDTLPTEKHNNKSSVFGVTYDHRIQTGVQISKMLKHINKLITSL